MKMRADPRTGGELGAPGMACYVPNVVKAGGSMWWRKQSKSTTSTRELLPRLNAGIEAGLVDKAVFDKVLAELDLAPEEFLPSAGGELAQTAFLLWKSGRSSPARHILFRCLAWYLSRADDQSASSLTQSIQYVYENEGRSVSVSEVHRAAMAGAVAVTEPPAASRTEPAQAPAGAAFRRFGNWFLERDQPSYERDILCPDCGWESLWLAREEQPPAACPACHYAGAGIPFTRFDGWLKFHNPAHLTPVGNAVMNFCCPGFLSQEANEDAKRIRARRLAESGVTHIASMSFGCASAASISINSPRSSRSIMKPGRVVRLIHQALIARFVPHPEGIGEAIETRDLPRGFWKHAD
jgi:hypothetical protein